MRKRIHLSPPHLELESLQYIEDAVKSNWIAPVGPHVDAFERELADFLKVSTVVATNSGTSAIHLALLSLGVKRGDEVICSTFTFCASANPIAYCNAIPVFVDSKTENWNMDSSLLEEAILDRTKKKGRSPKAIIVVHLYGVPADINEIKAIADKYQIPIIEDAAEALGSLYGGQQVGTFGQIGILSFNGNKIITTSSGGALFSLNTGAIESAKYFRQEAREPVPHYEHKAVGYNYRMSNLLAAVGRSQLKVLQARVTQRRLIFEHYERSFTGISNLQFQREPEGSRSNRWLTVIDFQRGQETVETVRKALEENNIESRRAWKPMHLQPVFSECPAYVNGVSESIFNNALCLPSGSSMGLQDVELVTNIVKEVL